MPDDHHDSRVDIDDNDPSDHDDDHGAGYVLRRILDRSQGRRGVWSCAFSYEFNGTALDRSLWLARTTKGSGFDLNDHGCFMDSPSNVS